MEIWLTAVIACNHLSLVAGWPRFIGALMNVSIDQWRSKFLTIVLLTMISSAPGSSEKRGLRRGCPIHRSLMCLTRVMMARVCSLPWSWSTVGHCVNSYVSVARCPLMRRQLSWNRS